MNDDIITAVRFLSCEPLLGPVDLRTGRYATPPTGEVLGTSLDGIAWVIVGGESGPHARPMHPDWARSLRDQCVAAGVAYHFKQWGEWTPLFDGRELRYPLRGSRLAVNLAADGRAARDGHPGEPMIRLGKKAAGRELDGRTWDEYPEVTR